MITCNEEKYRALLRLYSESTSSTTIVFLRGDRGMGKTEVINEFISQRKNVINVSYDNPSEPYLSPFGDALNKYYSDNEKTFSISNKGLDYRENYASQILSAFSQDTTILSIASINKSSCDYIDFYMKFVVHYIKVKIKMRLSLSSMIPIQIMIKIKVISITCCPYIH